VRLLLDTHAFLWWLDGDRRIPRKARALVTDDDKEVFLSAASVREITTKARLGRLPRASAVAADVPSGNGQPRFAPLSITTAHAQRAGSLPGPHRDPFDRMLVAQADLEGLPIVSMDAVFEEYRVTRLW